MTSHSMMKTIDTPQLTQHQSSVSAMLIASGVRATSARCQVLAVLLDARRALSHLEVQMALPDLDRVTLYRALDCLYDAGITHKIPGDDRVFRYSTGHEPSSVSTLIKNQHAHGHFKCTRCTRVFCLDDAQHPDSPNQLWQASLQSALGAGFQSHEIELTIKGWCADCAH